MVDRINFDIYGEVLTRASALSYEAERAGIDPDSVAIRNSILSEVSGRYGPNSMVEAELIVAARTAGRLAVLADKAEAEGFGSAVARLELWLGVQMGDPLAMPAMVPGGIVDTIRGVVGIEPMPISLFEPSGKDIPEIADLPVAGELRLA